jgi:phosphoglycerol transferase
MTKKTDKHSNARLAGRIALRVLTAVLVLAGFIASSSALWCYEKYGDIGFDAILFTLTSDLGGTSDNLISSYIIDGLLPALVCSALALAVLLFRNKSKIVAEFFGKFRVRLFPFKDWFAAVIALVLSVVLVYDAANMVGADSWLVSLFTEGTLYEDEYVDPATANITFPEEKRNLIYIYMESMEETFFSKDEGGALDYNVIPNLYNLATENINFSNTSGVGGCTQITGATWTMGAIVAQSSGIPLRLPENVDVNSYGNYSQFLPGVTTLNDLLHDAGYYQSFMCGSGVTFAGRDKYYLQHGVDDCFDVTSAKNEGLIPSDYSDGWWGMEDAKLYAYARQKLTEIAANDQPFAFTMLTVDTHHIGGNYQEECCEDTYSEQYENVYACADRQIYSFIQWLEQQDFYENTTIIITGDHLSMDAQYMARNISDDSYTRRIYNCFINSAVEPVREKNREFSQMDMFPTTLAAMGCEIEGDRLGLGVNLFSDSDTLVEKYGYDEFDAMVAQKSAVYDSKFLVG